MDGRRGKKVSGVKKVRGKKRESSKREGSMHCQMGNPILKNH